MGVKQGPIRSPRGFARAVAQLRTTTWRPELVVAEAPSPQRIAPYSAAITADVIIAGEEVGSGRLVLLHDSAGNTAWQGEFRLVTFARATVDPEMAADPLLTSVGWTWLLDALAAHEAEYIEPSGTVTAVTNESFGGLSAEAPQAEIEIRASWTPKLDPTGTSGDDFRPHLAAWGDLLCHTVGLPPLPAGVAMISSRSRSSVAQRR